MLRRFVPVARCRTPHLSFLRAFASDASPPPTSPISRGALRRRRNRAKDAGLSRASPWDAFHIVLALAALGLESPKMRVEAWRRYHGLRSNPGALKSLSATDWDILWATQSHQSPEDNDNPHMMEHLRILCKDMEKVSVTATTMDKIAIVESHFLEGSKQLALESYRAWAEEGIPEPYNSRFLELGVIIYVDAGENLQAHAILEQLVEDWDGDWVPGPFWQVFEAHIANGSEESMRLAWVLYQFLRSRLQSSITEDDFHACLLAFSGAGQLRRSFHVFQDMLSFQQAQEEGKREDINVLAEAKQLGEMCRDAAQANEAYLIGLTAIPSSKRLLDSWAHRLLRLHATKSAVQVVELMFERGVRPAAAVLNKIIAAWISEDDINAHNKAEALALRMVHARLRQHTTDSHSSAAETESSLPPFMRRLVPPATVDTFGLLLELYRKGGAGREVDNVVRWMDQVELDPNRRALHIQMMADLEKGVLYRVWERFSDFYQAGGFPDEVTWTLLWKGCEMKLARAGSRVAQRVNVFPGPAYLMHQMLKWHKAIRFPERVINNLSNRDRMYNLIMKAFCTDSRNLCHILVAMHALNHAFGIYPTQTAIRWIVDKISRIGLPGRSRNQRKKARGEPVYQQKEAKTVQAMRILTNRHMDALPDPKQAPTHEQAMELKLDITSELIRRAMWSWEVERYRSHRLGRDRSEEASRWVEYLIDGSKARMGVRHIKTGVECHKLKFG